MCCRSILPSLVRWLIACFDPAIARTNDDGETVVGCTNNVDRSPIPLADGLFSRRELSSIFFSEYGTCGLQSDE